MPFSKCPRFPDGVKTTSGFELITNSNNVCLKDNVLDKKKKTAIVINLVVCANMHINFIFRFSFLVDHEIGTGQTLTATWKDK